MTMPFHTPYWNPKFKDELVDWLTVRYPEDRGKFQRMKKKKLYKIYHELRGR